MVELGSDGIQQAHRRLQAMLFARGGAVSDDRGQFRIQRSAPGRLFDLRLRPKDSMPIGKTLLTRARRHSGKFGGAQTRWCCCDVPSDVPPRQHAWLMMPSPITVGYADERRGIDITVQPVAARRVTGRLVGGGRPPCDPHVDAYGCSGRPRGDCNCWIASSTDDSRRRF